MVGDTVMIIEMVVMVMTEAMVKALRTITAFRLSAHRALMAHVASLMPCC